MIQVNTINAISEKWGRYYQPLRVRMVLQANSRMVNYHPLQLDGLLARAVVEQATEGRGLPDAQDGYWLPLPLEMLWQSADGYPLWAASTFYPVGSNVEDTYVRHKRNSEGAMHSHKKLTTRNGPWMERRLPTPVRVCTTYEARAIGNLEAVADLLKHFVYVGKLRLARVDGIEVTAADYSDSEIVMDGMTLIKTIPAEAQLLKLWPEAPVLVGWTPPQWKPSLFRLGWSAGTRNPVDWFAAV
jgi:hypothetical protein